MLSFGRELGIVGTVSREWEIEICGSDSTVRAIGGVGACQIGRMAGRRTMDDGGDAGACAAPSRNGEWR